MTKILKDETLHGRIPSSSILQWRKNSDRQQHRTLFHAGSSKPDYPMASHDNFLKLHNPESGISRVLNYDLLEKGTAFFKASQIWPGTQPSRDTFFPSESFIALTNHYRVYQSILQRLFLELEGFSAIAEVKSMALLYC